MGKSPEWIIASQKKDDFLKYSGPVVWVSKCLRCGMEEPTYEGPLSVGIFQGKEFIRLHKNCKTLSDQISGEYRTHDPNEKWPGKNMGD